MSHAARRAIPNAITLLRLALAVAFFVILAVALGVPQAEVTAIPGGLAQSSVDQRAFERATEGRAFWGLVAVILFIVAALTDVLDGWLARRWQVVSVFGRIMDPFCDKVLVLGAFVFLVGPAFIASDGGGSLSGLAPWMVVTILGRELLVTSLRGVLESMGVDFSADVSGKIKMLAQSICVPICLFVGTREWALGSEGWRLLRDVAVWATVALTVWSVMPYLLRGRALLSKARGR